MEVSQKVQIEKVTPEGIERIEDEVAVEAAVRIYYGDKGVVDLSATPANLDELAVGYAVTQNIVEDVRYIGNVTKISELKRSVEIKEEIPAIKIKKKIQKRIPVDPGKLLAWAGDVFLTSPLSISTGGVHMAALYIDERKYCYFEDVSRHNAIDKAVGYAVLHRQCLEDAVMFVSGRISADYLKKAVRAGVKTVVSPSAVTSRAIEVAQNANVELWGFARNGKMNRY